MTQTAKDYYAGGLSVESYDAFYEAALAHSPVAGDVEFYVDLAKKHGPRVLEIAVGTGRIAIPLAEAGAEVTGVDLSPAMLSICRRRVAERGLSERVHLVEGAMESFDLNDKFDLAIISFRSFHHADGAQGQRRTLENVRKHLRSGGLFTVDIFDADLSTVVPGAASPAQPREIVDPRTGHRIRRETIARDSDPFTQTFMETMRISRFDAEGKLLGEDESSFSMRWVTHNEMKCMLELAGFVDLQCFGDFQRGPAGYKREQIWLARAP